MKTLGLALLLGALAFSTPAAAETTQIDERFRGGTFDWSGNGSTLVRWRAILVDGKIGVCGAWSARGGGNYTRLSRQAIADMRVERDGVVFMRGLSFFNAVGAAAYQSGLEGRTANCRITSTPGTPADLKSMRLQFTPQRYRS